MKKNNKILYISIAVLVLAVGILIGTYSYYQTTTTAYGYPCDWKYVDFIYFEAIEDGLIAGDIEAELASFHPDFINAAINFVFVCDDMVKITLSDGTVIELPQFQFFPRFTSFYEPSGS